MHRNTDFYGMLTLVIISIVEPFVLIAACLTHFWYMLVSMNYLGLLPPTLEKGMSSIRWGVSKLGTMKPVPLAEGVPLAGEEPASA